MEYAKKVKTIRIDNSRHTFFDTVGVEGEVNVFLNDIFISRVVCTPLEISNLAVGFLFSKKLIGEVIKVREAHEEVHVTSRGVYERKYPKEFSISANVLNEKMRELLSSSSLFFQTGAYHLCGLLNVKDIKFSYVTQDISRYAAIEKCIGFLLTHPFQSKTALLTSGRVNKEITRICADAGVGLLASKNAVTHEAIQLSHVLGLTLVGFVRENRLNLYSGFERVI